MADASTIKPLASCFTRAAALKPGRVFLTTANAVLTYGEILDHSARLASVWAAAGLNQGDRVVLASRDDVAVVVMFLSLIRSGLTAVIIDPQSPAPEALNLIRASAARGIVLDRELKDQWGTGHDFFTLEIHKTAGRNSSLFNKLLGRNSQPSEDLNTYPSIVQRFEPMELLDELPPDLVAYIMFTSGTTSRPKGVQITHANLAHHLGTLSRQFGYDRSSRILNVLPLNHTDGMTQGPVVAFWNGASVFRPSPFSISSIGRLMDSIYAERITHFVAVPTILALILRFGQDYPDSFRTPDFRFVISAAAQLEAELWSGFEDAFHTRVVNLYGLTETVTGGLFSGPGDDSHRIGTVGRPVDCEVRIVDNDGNDVPAGTPGELLIRGGNVMKGYLNNDADTTATLRNGWLFSGDIATMDVEGFYRIVGRKKNLIITGGINVHPEEVTEVLNKHPHVLESCVFGEADTAWGEKVAAAVLLDGKAHVYEAELVNHCRGSLAPAKVPHRISIVQEMPKGPSGKIIISSVKAMVDESSVDPVETGTAGLRHRIFGIAAKAFKVPADQLSPASRPSNTAGWDSLAHLAFLLEIEKAFLLKLSPREILAVESLEDAERIVSRQTGGC